MTHRAVAFLLLAPVVIASCGGKGDPRSTSEPARQPARTTTTRLAFNRVGRLPAPLQLPATAATPGGRVLVLGGLSAADTSTDGIAVVRPSGAARTVGRLPARLHDAAAAGIGGHVYLFGGGDQAESDAVLSVTRAGRAAPAGKLPARASDVAAAAIGSTAYVVGGYTGTAPLRSIVAFSPGRGVRRVGTLPRPLRYAAVAAVGGKLLIAGGTSGTTAQRAVLRFDPRTGRTARVATLPRPLTHAAGAARGRAFYVIGGRGDALNSAAAAVWAVDPATGRVRAAGRLPTALSDAGAAGTNGGILVIGGRDGRGRVHDDILIAKPATRRPHRRDVYAADRPGMLSPVVRGFPQRVYVPNSQSNTVDVIDQRTFRIVRHFRTGAVPQHVTPSYDLKTLWVDNDEGNSLTKVDPRTGRPGKRVPVIDPYNLYFTPSGRFAIVVAERLKRLDFRYAHSMKLHRSLAVPTCAGVDHMDFTASGRYALASCEFAGRMVVVDIPRERVVRTINLRAGAMPQDVKLAPDGRTFYVADMASNGVWLLDGHNFRKRGFVRTGRGTHGLYASRDSRYLYVSNRGEGTISLISFRTRRVAKKWRLPGHASPDMGGVSSSGRVLWLSGRYDAEVYAISTRTGKLIKRIRVGSGPHGLCVYPQPGRYSLGHTGVFR